MSQAMKDLRGVTPRKCADSTCKKAIVRRLYYQLDGQPYCSYLCFQKAVIAKASERNPMIDPNLPNPPTGGNMSAATATVPKKKKKKGATAPASAAAGVSTTKKKKTSPGGGDSPFRPGSIVAELYERLKDGKVKTHEQLFKGIESNDAGRLIVDLKKKGEKTKLFTVERPEVGSVQLILSKKK